MKLVTKVRLFRSPYTICYISKDQVALPDEKYYKTIGVNAGDFCDVSVEDEEQDTVSKKLKFTASALFLQPFLKECLNSEVYRCKVLSYLSHLAGSDCGLVVLNLTLEPPDKEVIDFVWNEKILRLVWTRVEIENAFSWLSTLGGAYSALGDYFEYCAEEAGRISMRQYKLSKMLGDDSLAARSCLYSALSHAQKGNLKLARHIVRKVVAFGRATQDKRLIRMCQGVWAKLKYLRELEESEDRKTKKETSQNGVVNSK
uniref:Uncharacterized protein n=1 Tax=Pectinophora gossypiella TaxID=13191 RepID=A0A1E1WIQ9_PECGO